MPSVPSCCRRRVRRRSAGRRPRGSSVTLVTSTQPRASASSGSAPMRLGERIDGIEGAAVVGGRERVDVALGLGDRRPAVDLSADELLVALREERIELRRVIGLCQHDRLLCRGDHDHDLRAERRRDIRGPGRALRPRARRRPRRSPPSARRGTGPGCSLAFCHCVEPSSVLRRDERQRVRRAQGSQTQAGPRRPRPCVPPQPVATSAAPIASSDKTCGNPHTRRLSTGSRRGLEPHRATATAGDAQRRWRLSRAR